MFGRKLETSLPDALFRRVSDQAPYAMVLTSGPQHRIVYANSAFGRLVRSEPDTLVGRSIHRALPELNPAALDETRRTLEPAGRTGQPMELTSGEGTTWWDFSSTPLRSPGDDDSLILTTAQEVTDHVAARREAEAAGATLDALMAHIPEGITIARGPGVLVERVSAYGRALTQRAAAELIGADARAHPESWEIYLPGSDVPLPPDERPLARAIATGEVISNQTLILRRPDGSLLPVLCSSGPIKDALGQVTGAILAWRDIDDLHRAEATARRSAERLALALRAGGFGTWESDLANGVTVWDATVAEMLGLSTEEMVSPAGRLASFIHSHDRERVMEAYWSAARSGMPYEAEFRTMTAQGQERWVSCQAVFADSRAIAVVRDITERRRREEQLKQTLLDRELLVREADHRIKNSLQLIASLLQMQQRRLSDPEASAALGDAIARVNAVGEAHRSLHQSGDLRTVNFCRTLSDICSHVASLTATVRVTFSSAEDLQLDAERAIPLGLMVSELLTNASKHAYPRAGGEVRVDAWSTPDALHVCISDDGVGLPDSDGAGGTGLGSAIIRGLAKQVGASIEVLSSDGAGTTVTLCVPHATSAPRTGFAPGDNAR